MPFSNKTAFAALAVLATLASFSCGHKSDGDAQECEESQAGELPAIGFYCDRYEVDSTAVRSGDTFSSLMSRLGMGSSESYRLTTVCDSVIDLRRIKAGNRVLAYYDRDGDSTRVLRYMVYEHNRIKSTVFRCTDSLAAWNYDKPVEKQRKYADVTINSSLWNDMIASGASPTLIMNLDDIYQWSINFFTLQKGDRFRIIYSQSVCEGEVVSIDSLYFSLFNGADGKEVAAVLYDTGQGGNTYWDKGGESLKRMFLKAPLKYTRISSRFSYRRKHPVTGKVKAHTAVDYAAPTGTEVQAIGDGVVTKCGWDGTGGGNRIKIKHVKGYESSYMHLSKFAKNIKAGTRVSQGQVIGYVGATGTATGPHLDFRIWENGRPIDPLSLNSPAAEPLAKEHLEAFNILYDKYMKELNDNTQTGGTVTEEGPGSDGD